MTKPGMFGSWAEARRVLLSWFVLSFLAWASVAFMIIAIIA